MRRILSFCAGLTLAALLALVAAGCATAGRNSTPPPAPTGTASAPPPQAVDVTSSGFSPAQVRVDSGQVVMFTNETSSQATICLGSLGTCAGTTFGPKALTGNGMQLTKNESFPVVFSKPGTYRVTSPGNTNRSMSIVVQGT